MFNRKKIKDLEERLSYLEFKDRCKPKYKVGDIENGYMIVKVEIVPNYMPGFYGGDIGCGWKYQYHGFNRKTKAHQII